jgi:YfiH family protein
MPDVVLAPYEVVDDFAAYGVRAFTTTRAAGSFATAGDEPVGAVMARWSALQEELAPVARRFANAVQVHGNRVVVHAPGWEGWLRVIAGADGHASIERGTALAVMVADCVPVFIAHPSGAIALLHSGWRGTASRIVEHGIDALARRGLPASELRVHLGPAICGRCYEVSPDVYGQLTARSVSAPTTVDLRVLIADHARAAGVRHIDTSAYCTRCDNDRFYSHRAGDAGRQIGVMVAASG